MHRSNSHNINYSFNSDASRELENVKGKESVINSAVSLDPHSSQTKRNNETSLASNSNMYPNGNHLNHKPNPNAGEEFGFKPCERPSTSGINSRSKQSIGIGESNLLRNKRRNSTGYTVHQVRARSAGSTVRGFGVNQDGLHSGIERNNYSTRIFKSGDWAASDNSVFVPTIMETSKFHHTKIVSGKTWKRLLHIPFIDDEVHHGADKEYSLKFKEMTTSNWDAVRNKKKREKELDQEYRNNFGKTVRDKHFEKMKAEALKREKIRKSMEKIQLFHANTNYKETQRKRRTQVAKKLKAKPQKKDLKPASEKLVDSLQELDFSNPFINAQLEEEMTNIFERYNEMKVVVDEKKCT